MASEVVRPIRIFYSYAHQDQDLVRQLESHLNVLRRSGLIEEWSYQDISAGDEMESVIVSRLNQADIILLLISPDFMNSDYTYGIEMKRAMEKHEQGTATVIPIILRPTAWQDSPFGKLQPLPRNEKPVIRWSDRDDAFAVIVREIREVVLELQKSIAVQIDWVAEGNRLLQADQYSNALIAFEQAIVHESDSIAAYIGKGDALRHLGQSLEALAAYEQAIRLEPGNVTVYMMRGRALSDLGRFPEALSTYQRIIQLSPNNADAYIEQGNALSAMQRFEEALAAYQYASGLSPSNSAIYLSMANILLRLERYDEALAICEKVDPSSPNFLSIALLRGDILLQLQQYRQALETYTQAVKLDEKNVYAHLGMGEALLQLRRYEEALIAFDTATIFEPNNLRANERKAEILRMLGYADEAVSVTQQAINLGSTILISPDRVRIEAKEIQESQTRVKLIQQFLTAAGFELNPSLSGDGFLARVRSSIWKKYFQRGVYIRVLLDNSLDQRTVQTIARDARNYGIDHALVIINQQPDFSGSAEINILRWEQGYRHFVCLPIDESLILESIATHKEQLELQKYVSKRLGREFDPYSVVDPVSDAVSFFGRLGLIEELSEDLRRGQRLGLFGIQKMGKSSVLQLLQKRIEFPVAYVYLRTDDTLDRIFRRILEDWSLNGHVKYPTDFHWMAPQFPLDTITPGIFDDVTRDLASYLNTITSGASPMLGIFLDEIEHIVPQKGDNKTLRLYIDLMDSLRGLYQETQNICLLVAGVHPGIARDNFFWDNQKNPMHQIITERFLPPLDRDDCQNMIRDLGQQINLKYETKALDYILEMSGSHPFLARRLCSLVNKRNRNIRIVTVEMVAEAVKEFVSNPIFNSYFDEWGLWREISMPDLWKEQVGLANKVLLQRLAASSQELSEIELCAGLDRNVAQEALFALKERSLIHSPTSSGYYHITFGLLRNWIRFRLLGLALD